MNYKNQFAALVSLGNQVLTAASVFVLSCEEQKRHTSRYDCEYFSTCMMNEKTTLFIHIPVCRCGAERFHVRLCCTPTLLQLLFQLCFSCQ